MPTIHHYFVDEAGDPTLFGSRGKVLLGSEGCSRYFMLGVAHVAEPKELERALKELRAELMGDRYFSGVPSFDPKRRKTALFFHAKNDLHEVRYRVFRLLQQFDIRVHVLVRDKYAILEEVKERQQHEPHYRYRENDVYDDCTCSLFENLLHRADENHIVFARRGNEKRIVGLWDALDRAKSRYRKTGGEIEIGPTTVDAFYPRERAGLQAIDYCLWALQRKYEKGEERFYEFLKSKFELVLEADAEAL